MTITYTQHGRFIEQGQEVECYFNLHKKVFSIKDVKTDIVLAHADHVGLFDCEFKVSEAGRQRVLREQRKHVHARVRGKYIPYRVDCINMREGYYNPYKTETFVDKENGTALHKADLVVLEDKQIKYWSE